MENKPAPLSAAMEDYVKAIYEVQAAQAEVTTTALAKQMDVSAASATNMIKKLAGIGLVRYSPYHGVTLTRPGEKIALEVLRHHRLIELFLNETLGIPWDEVHDEAHRLEHVLSDNLENHIAELLGDPTEDPHGDPIPTKGGAIVQAAQQTLAELPAGTAAVIRRVGDQDPEHLRYFSRIGLVPSATVNVVEREPFGGPLHVRIGSGDQVVDGELARRIWVTRPDGVGLTKPLSRNRSAKPRRTHTN